jgi:ethanolamine ammonia-lyase small subunit
MNSPLDPWQGLRRLTAARIAQGHAGVSMPTAPQLAFQLAHAQARDAVHVALDVPALAAALALPSLRVHSQAADRQTYLRRPDLGRVLDEASRDLLVAHHGDYDLSVVLADGLSAPAIARHAAPFIALLSAALPSMKMAPPVFAEQARVALGDDIAVALGARLVVVLIGERPGLSSPDSMGIYMTWAPVVGLTDERRNCISNVRPEGLAYADAVAGLVYLIEGARRLGTSGVALKDERDGQAALVEGGTGT